MEKARPDNAQAYASGEEDWWRYGAQWLCHVKDTDGRWVPDAEKTLDNGTM